MPNLDYILERAEIEGLWEILLSKLPRLLGRVDKHQDGEHIVFHVCKAFDVDHTDYYIDAYLRQFSKKLYVLTITAQEKDFAPLYELCEIKARSKKRLIDVVEKLANYKDAKKVEAEEKMWLGV